MASSSSSSFLFLSLLLLTIVCIAECKEFLVGGSTDGWKIPSTVSDSLNKWAESSRFQVDDSLVWKYDGSKDSVLQVTRKDYLSCNTSSPIKEYKDGHTIVTLPRSGPYFFISGANGACEKGEKLIVVVMSPRKYGRTAAPAPSPMMVDVDGPAVAPTSGVEALKMEVRSWGFMVGALLVMGMFLV